MLSACLAALTLLAQPAQPVRDVLENGAFQKELDGWSSSGNPEIRRGGGSGPGMFIVVKTTTASPVSPWAVVTSHRVDLDIPEGTEMTLSFRAKSPQGIRVAAMVEDVEAPNAKHVLQEFKLTPEWKEYRVSGRAPKLLMGGTFQAGFHSAFDSGEFHLGQVSLTVPASAVPSLPTTTEPMELIKDGSFEQPWGQAWSGGDSTSITAAIVPDQRFGRALRVTIPEGTTTPNPWSIQVGQALANASRAGDRMYLQLWMRSPQGSDAWVVHELAEPPHSKSLMRRLDVTPQWQEFRATFMPGMAFAPGRSQFKLFFGTQTGVIEVANVRLTNYGSGAYPASIKPNVVDYDPSADRKWRADALKRIERIRKGDITITVLDSARRPVPNAQVKLDMTRHHFRFGTALPARMVIAQGSDGDQFRRHIREVFNTVTFENDLKWPAIDNWTPFADTQKAQVWLKDNGFKVRGHTLVWGSYGNLPTGMKDLSDDQIRQRIRERVQDMALRTKDWVYVWDVVNEAVTEVELWDRLGWSEFVNTFKQARAAMPGVKLAYNDFNITNENPAGTVHRGRAIGRALQIIEGGAPLDIFGDQAHQSPPGTPMSRVLAGWDEVHRAVKRPIEITEFDFTSTDDVSHAAYTEDYLTAAFSHPAVDAFIFWGFWQGAHWLANSGGHSVNRDWTPRPAWKRVTDLINRQWKTSIDAKVNSRGVLKQRAFYGTYKATITAPPAARRGPARPRPGVEVRPPVDKDGKPVAAGERKVETTLELVPGKPGEFVVILP